ncbi:30S ribosomal protein S8e [Candidatus Woesearchaeota archaeon]|nr:30S ribosomal protein S8e [Candidatus Woesearchaeota archaeon]
MVVIHGKPKRKPTGGRYTDAKTKRLHQKGSHATHTKIGKQHVKTVPTKGGGSKTRLYAAEKVNIYDPKTKKFEVAQIQTAAENPADRHFVRHNIITKGAIVNTSKGKARVTNRPGQEGVINGVLVE